MFRRNTVPHKTNTQKQTRILAEKRYGRGMRFCSISFNTNKFNILYRCFREIKFT